MTPEYLTGLFLLAALSAYALFGGADFGGGLLEATLSRHRRIQQKIQETLAPVWEANHVWLVAVIVILFVGFPRVYASLMTHLFVPVSVMLLGIILRGAFFTFRKYDPEPDVRRAAYSALFRASSALTPAMFGFIIAALLRPFPTPGAGGADFAALYVKPWLTLHGALCALFVNILFGYVAAVFLLGEVRDPADRAILRGRVYAFFAAMFLAGAIVLAWGAATGIVSWHDELNPVQITAQVVAALGIPLMALFIRRGRDTAARVVAGAQVFAILTGWFATQFPTFLRFDNGTALTLHNAGAPAITLRWLNIGLAVVLAVVVPFLIYLYRVFSAARGEAMDESAGR